MSTAIKSLVRQRRQQGFALIEVALAVMIAASVFLATMEFLEISTNRASAERMGQDINEIFNAGISYYLTNSDSWPDSIQSLVNADLLPSSAMQNPWGYDYKVAAYSGTQWTIGTCLPKSVAVNLAALLPFGAVEDSTADNCNSTADNIKYVTTTINQVASSTDSLSTTMVQSGDKVAAPTCPTISGKQYEPHIYLLPAAFDAGGHVISAMSAYADALSDDDTTDYPNGYWVVHLDLTTDQGTIEDNEGNALSSNPAAIVAFTNCMPPSE